MDDMDDLSQPWSWLLTAVGVLGLWFAGRGNALGWAIGLGSQGLWIVYAVTTQQWGFLASVLVYGWVYARNWQRWRSGGAGRRRDHDRDHEKVVIGRLVIQDPATTRPQMPPPDAGAFRR